MEDLLDEKKPIDLAELVEVIPESFNDLIVGVIQQAVTDYCILNPFSQKEINEYNSTEAVEFQTAEDFLFNEVRAFGDLNWTFEDACTYMGWDAKKMRTKLFALCDYDPVMPSRHQMELF